MSRSGFTSFACLSLLMIAQLARAQNITVLPFNAAWRYTSNNVSATSWTLPAYDDSTWSGPGGALLYIEADPVPAPKVTPLPGNGSGLPMPCYYFRAGFDLPVRSNVTALVFTNLVDDGAVFYLNGVEVQRVRMAAGAVSYATQASSTPPGGDATAFERFVLSGDALTNLVEGTNILAVEVHQFGTGSSDIVFGSSVSALYGSLPANLLRGPYLQLSTTNRVSIRWRTDVAADSRVSYGDSPTNLLFSVSNTAAVIDHEVVLTNLQPDTRYFYAAGTMDSNHAGPGPDYFFLTHPAPLTPKDIRVWVIGDAGTKNANQTAVRNAFTNFNGTNLVHAWLQLGDNAYDAGTDAEYQAAVFAMYPMLLRNSVTWPTLGNHDSAHSTAFVDTYPYFDIFTLPTAGEAGGAPSGTEHYYSFDLGQVHFICLDSMTASRATNGAMATWLRADLALNSNRWTIAYWHHPPYTKGSHDSDLEGELIEMRQNFLPILEVGGVDLVLGGHSHSYERSYLLNAHYASSANFSGTNILQAGGGRATNGPLGAYLKPDGLGESPVGNQGAVYAVAGSSGQISGGPLNHPAMFTSQNVLGSLVLDFRSNRLDALFLRETGATNDWFSLIKEGTHPPRLTNALTLGGGAFQFTVLGRGWRTNVIEATDTLPAGWTALATNFSTNASFDVQDGSAGAFSNRFYRVRRP